MEAHPDPQGDPHAGELTRSSKEYGRLAHLRFAPVLEAMERTPAGQHKTARRAHDGMADGGNQPRTRRRNLLALGVSPGKVHMATRSRKGYWRMSQNELVRIALNNRWLEEQGVPDMNAPAAVASLLNAKPDRMDGGTESKTSGWFFTTGLTPESDWTACLQPTNNNQRNLVYTKILTLSEITAKSNVVGFASGSAGILAGRKSHLDCGSHGPQCRDARTELEVKIPEMECRAQEPRGVSVWCLMGKDATFQTVRPEIRWKPRDGLRPALPLLVSGGKR